MSAADTPALSPAPLVTDTKLAGCAVHPSGRTPPSKLSNWQSGDAEGEGVLERLVLGDSDDVEPGDCVVDDDAVPVVLELGVPV